MTVKHLFFSKSFFKMLFLLSMFEGRIHFDRENRGNSVARQRARVEEPFKGPLTQHRQDPYSRAVWGIRKYLNSWFPAQPKPSSSQHSSSQLSSSQPQLKPSSSQLWPGSASHWKSINQEIFVFSKYFNGIFDEILVFSKYFNGIFDQSARKPCKTLQKRIFVRKYN